MLDEAAKMTMMRHENLLRIVGVCLSGDDLQVSNPQMSCTHGASICSVEKRQSECCADLAQ